MTDIEAAIGIVQLGKLDGFNEKRRKNAIELAAHLRKFPWIAAPVEGEDSFHIYHQFTIRIKNGKRDDVVKMLSEEGVGAKVFYPIPLHHQPYYKKIMKKTPSLPVSEKAAMEVISLPVHPGLTDDEKSIIRTAFDKINGRI
jgi:dTDP-4-amino-4,6-dideoxygalactose transaminase